MGVLVRIDMGDCDTGLLQSQDLCHRFPLDVGGLNSAKVQVANKFAESCAKCWLAGTLVGGIEQSGNSGRMCNRAAIHQDDVTADAKQFLLQGNFNRFVETGPRGHQGC